ncbi:MAG: hypothetical protein ACFFEV_03135 [Candidatus Thorarchaeota archaeon]
MRHFLILFDDIPIDKASVRSGNNSSEVITAARCVNVGLFISGDLRRDVVLSLAKGNPNDLRIISFPGVHLRRVSPDERSVSFFLLKAIALLEEMEMDSIKTMDNGIEVRRTSLESFLESLTPSRVYISHQDSKTNADEYTEYEDSLIVYYFLGSKFDPLQLESKWEQRDLSHLNHPERFILNINMSVDMKKAS